MEAVQKRPPIEGLKHFASTRRGAYTIAAASAVLAGLVLLVFITKYKNNVDAGLAPAPVLTADRLIPAGTAGNEVLSEKLFKPTAVSERDLKLGAVTDSSSLAGKVAVRDILPGQQIVAADFIAGADPIRSRLHGTDRAIQIPVDKNHALIGTLRVGDRVDVLTTFDSTADGRNDVKRLKPLIRGVRIMALRAGSVIVEAPDKEAAALSFAADNGRLTFLLRPPVGAENSRDITVTEDSVANMEPFIVKDPAAARGGNK